MTNVVVNWWAVIVSVVAAMAIGGIWYSKAVFGKAWMQGLGKTEEQIKQGAGKAMAGMVILALLQAYIMGALVYSTQATTLGAGLFLGFLLWLGFVFPFIFGLRLFENRPWPLFWINAGNQLLTLLAMGVILAVWH